MIFKNQVERLDITGTGEDKAVQGVTLASGAKITAKKEVEFLKYFTKITF